MKTLAVLSLVAILVLSGCIDNKNGTSSTVNSPAINKTDIADSILGKWTADNESVEFFEEGKMVISRQNENPVTGSYKFIDDNQIMISVERLGTNIIWKIINMSDNESIIFTGQYNIKKFNKESYMSDTGTDTNVGTDWCVPGSKTTHDNEEFSVVGITTYENKNNVCKAERPIPGGSSVIYFNKEYLNKESGAFIVANSVSSGKNAHSEAKAVVSIGTN